MKYIKRLYFLIFGTLLLPVSLTIYLYQQRVFHELIKSYKGVMRGKYDKESWRLL